MPTMTEDAGRFWTTVFGGITAIGLIAGGIYTLVQYQNSKTVYNENLRLQLANAKFEAEKPFYQRQLDLCADASSAAAILATPSKHTKEQLATAGGDFWRLYWGPLGIVEDSGVAVAMYKFGLCLESQCSDSLESSSLNLAHSCRDLIAESWKVPLQNLPANSNSLKPLH